ncbi:MAG: hypothetical protein HGB12_10165 [Bacteroidetes bacterium]|nr:hypothetical protein [Bacteroidota bacterium]
MIYNKFTKIAISIIFNLFAIIFLLSTFNCLAQNGGISINTTGIEADNSAMLDISSNSQGTLITRMTTTQRDSIAIKCSCTPAEGLQIYNTTTRCFEFYSSGVWQTITCGCSNAPAAAGIISGTATVCPGQIAVLYSVPAIARANSYVWSYSGQGAVIVGTANTAIVYFSGTATSGNLTVMGTNACGNGTVSADYAIAVNSTAPNIIDQPVSASTCLGSGAIYYTVTASGGLTYQWQEYISSWNNLANAGIYSNVNTATLTITNPPLSMNGYKYRCIVSGTCTNTTTDGLATLTVNSIPSVTNTSTATICSGTSPNITLTSSVSSNFTWTIGTVTGSISGASSSSGAAINQTLTNPSNSTAGSVQYIVTPTSTTGSCVGAAFTITVTVNPTPTVTNTPLTQSICSGGSTTLVSLTSGVSGATFAWTTTASGGISGFTSSGTNTIPVQTISNSGSTAGTVTYAITPTANNCSGAASNYEITINPLPTVSNSATASMCSGTGPNISLTSSVSSNFAWTIGTITGSITGAGSGSGSTINQTLTNPSNTSAGTVQYIVTPTSTTGSCAGSAFTITVTIDPLPAAPTAGTITHTGVQIVWNWNSVTGASGYKYNTNNNYSGATDIGTNTSYIQSGLSCNTPYTLYVWAYNACGGNTTAATLTQTTASFYAIGGTITTSSNNTIHTFTSSGTFTVTCGSLNANVLVVAGGGGGGSSNGGTYGGGGGGGAGGLLYNSSKAISSQSYTVTVGNGGSSSSTTTGGNGYNSVFSNMTAIGGGGGGYGGTGSSGSSGNSGGSGGGGGTAYSGGSGTSGQGYNGGNGNSTGYNVGGGGGGAGGVGSSPNTSGPLAGGAGVANSISGVSVIYSTGGNGSNATGGTRTDASPNSGNGGEGNHNGVSGAGGSGIVIISYPTP